MRADDFPFIYFLSDMSTIEGAFTILYAFSGWKSPLFRDFKGHTTQNPTTGARKD
jgi:hypothetical protein